jgi:aminoglycoside phosphotransferase (APT) family kinase protein
VAEAVAVDSGLETWLRDHGVPADVEVDARATGGLSQETWFVRVKTDADESDAVLRLPTPASGARAILIQRAALDSVAGRIPAPAVLWSDDGEENPFGRPFIVMSRVAGEVPVEWGELEPPVRRRLAEEAMDILAELHGIGGEALRAAPAPERGPAAELEFYERRLARFGPLPAVLRAGLWWLGRHVPPAGEPTTLVHGDFRMGNLVVGEDRVRAVLDWEMAGFGDPFADLTWCFIPIWSTAGVEEGELVDRYLERSGVSADPERLLWFRVLGYVRLAYYALSGSWAFAGGRSDDFRLAALRLQLPVHLDRLAATLAGEEVR